MHKRRSKDKNVVQPSETNMVCVVPKQNVEILGRALHSLARIGEELYLEPLNEGLTFRTVHSNHSVYAEVHFNNQFFSYYNCPIQSQGQGEDDGALKCRINMKSYLGAFRSLACIRKQVETCLLKIEPTWLEIKFRCHHGLIRTYRLPVIESETLQALYTVDEVPNHLVIGADIFATAVKNFQLNERDITLAVEERAAVLRNYVPGGTDPAGVVRSELKLDSGEFVSFTVRHQTSITFCLKAFRAVLFFSEPLNLPLAVKFSSPGSPVVIISDSSTVELRFVLSSLAPEDCDSSRSGSQQLLTPIQSSEGREQVQLHKKSSKTPQSLDEAWGEGSRLPNRTNQTTKTKQNINNKTHALQRQQIPSATSQQSTSSATSSVRAVVGTSVSSTLSRPRPNPLDSFEASLDAAEANGFGLQDIVIPASDDEAEEDEVVPAPRPPSKKARFFFQRCYEPTLQAADIDGGQVYVPDTDDEEED
ncbi:Cell cycle checkpoint control protein RAD9A [Frankliniella fusca]|uniref:Cell cycle checkpoint control protein RAD9A n=1 Tax=Frankliniella fusca TaxID=407009 RepID=A0AAE1LNZ1_9NEOP|nr:Cell cycle checkpoint control protein RAD9A [Frankliniella fusca]